MNAFCCFDGARTHCLEVVLHGQNSDRGKRNRGRYLTRLIERFATPQPLKGKVRNCVLCSFTMKTQSKLLERLVTRVNHAN